MGTSSKELARKLQKLAKRQHGCFTAAQAVETGYADSVHLYHVKTGNWARLFRGVYRFSEFPETPASRCMAALLWTRDKTGKIKGILTPETAGALRSGALSAADPIRIAVGKDFRRSSDVPEGIELSVLDMALHKSSKVNGLPALAPAGTAVAAPAPAPPAELDAADYYDWLDYQAVLCPPSS
jgi:hypothetical protein